jgi:HEAT repeats
MPTLPSSPRLDHLKGQAKRLLNALQKAEPDALTRLAAHRLGRVATPTGHAHPKLADAQFVLAREYGFPSWARLKTYVEALQEATDARAGRAQRRALRAQFLDELAASLLSWSRVPDPKALGARFALMPLRDILAIREHLHRTGELATVVDGLIEGLGHPEPRVRFDGANALDHLADGRCAVPLRRLLNDPVPRVRRAALHALTCEACKLDPLGQEEDLVPVMLNLAQHDSSVRVRRSAVPLLEGYLSNLHVVEALQQLAENDDPHIRRVAQQIVRGPGTSAELG